jgi:hypothetical protein
MCTPEPTSTLLAIPTDCPTSHCPKVPTLSVDPEVPRRRGGVSKELV